jgi:tetratricopeptide (TPR) repeat protein
MILPLCRSRLAATALSALIALAAQAQPEPPAAEPASPAPIVEPAEPAAAPAAAAAPEQPGAWPSAMTAELFYEVLVGELQTRSGDLGDGYELVLDAARRSPDNRLFRRAVEIALQARSGDNALAAARAWKDAMPESSEARRFELQILIALNRIGDTLEPLRAEIAATPEAERPALMMALARGYSQAADKKQAMTVFEQGLADELKNPATGGAAWVAAGRLRLAAGQAAGALDAALKGQEMSPSAEGPALLALELIDPSRPRAEAIVKRYLEDPKAQIEIRIAYARALAGGGRHADAIAELTALTEARPELPEPWLLLGGVQAQARQDAAAQASIRRFISLLDGQGGQDGPSDREAAKRRLSQAYLLMSQLAERRDDFAEADGWLARIDDAGDLPNVQMRRAALLARQGKLPQARELLRALPERTADDKRQKLLAEVQLLREAGQYQAAYDLLRQASAASPDDADLLYDQAMLAEKIDRLDEMERLLRRLIELKPGNQHAYNALGYSLADRKVRLNEAKTLIQKAVQLAPDDPFIADSLGWVEFRLGNTAQALRILEEAYKRRPDPEIGAHLGEVLWAAGKRDRALAVWKEASLADAANETLQETLKRLGVKL